jgi:putative redox protein
MKHEVGTNWSGGMRFNALVNGHIIVMDAPERVGGKNEGTIPKPLILAALSGCTGMDVVALLRKKGIELQGLNIRVEAELSKGSPMVYTSAHVIYEVQAVDPIKDEILHVVQRSQEELCGTSAMLRMAMPVTWEVQFNSAVIFTNRTEGSEVLMG